MRPIVGLTGNTLPEDTATFKAAGATDVMHKPLTMDVAHELLERFSIPASVPSRSNSHRSDTRSRSRSRSPLVSPFREFSPAF